MKIKDIVDTLEATVYYGEELMDVDIHSACASDMMSDVLAFVKDQIAIISSDYRMYTACGLLYARGLQPGDSKV